MKLQKGFTLIELMVSMAIVVSVVAIATDALMQAEHVTTMVAYESNTQENLRAGMHFMVRDLMQAGEGIPQGGISIPYVVNSAINRPGTAAKFPNTYITLPAITPGSQIGQLATSINPITDAVLTGVQHGHHQYLVRGQRSNRWRGKLPIQLSDRPGRSLNSGLCGSDIGHGCVRYACAGLFHDAGSDQPDYHR